MNHKNHQHLSLLNHVRETIHLSNYSNRKKENYIGWITNFIHFHNNRHPIDMADAEVIQFLNHLTNTRYIPTNTYIQALNALVFLYNDILNQPLKGMESIIKPQKPQPLPALLSSDNINNILTYLKDVHWLSAHLMYSTGLHMMECIRLRVKDLDFHNKVIIVHDHQGIKNRLVTLTDELIAPLQQQLDKVKKTHEQDLAEGFGRIYLPDALTTKDSTETHEWSWQYLFPAKCRHIDPHANTERRHHLDASSLQHALETAIHLAHLDKPSNCNTFQYAFINKSLQSKSNLGTMQENFGNKDDKSASNYSHLFKHSGYAVTNLTA